MRKTIIRFVLFLLLTLISSPLLAINAKDINEAVHNNGADWVAGETSISKLPPEAIKSLVSLIPGSKLGLKAKSNKYSAEAVLPAKVDWRNIGGRNYVTSIKNQGHCGACWAFSTIAVLESRILITSNMPDTDLDLSEQALISCDSNNSGCVGGYIDLASEFLETTGTPLESCYPYTSGNSSEAGACGGCADWQQNTYKITSFENIATSVEAIKNAIVQYGPVIVEMTIYEDFLYYVSGVYRHVTGKALGGHAIVIVGYDDADQSWIIKNSWGPNWGENGFFRMAAGINDCNIENIALSITYATVPGASFVLSPSNIDFGTLLFPDQPFLTQSFTITNNGSVLLTNTSCAVTNPRYSVIPFFDSIIESAASANVQVTYTPGVGKTPDTGELQVDSAGITRSISLTGHVNTRPAQPINLWPPDGGTTASGQPVTLSASVFVDDDGDAHEASQWIIQDSSGASVYSGSFNTANKTSFTVPSDTIQADTRYYWQVIYQDDRGAESSASALTSFTTSDTSSDGSNCFIATVEIEPPTAGQLNGFSLQVISGYLPFLTVGLLLFVFFFLRFKSKKLNAT